MNTKNEYNRSHQISSIFFNFIGKIPHGQNTHGHTTGATALPPPLDTNAERSSAEQNFCSTPERSLCLYQANFRFLMGHRKKPIFPTHSDRRKSSKNLNPSSHHITVYNIISILLKSLSLDLLRRVCFFLHWREGVILIEWCIWDNHKIDPKSFGNRPIVGWFFLAINYIVLQHHYKLNFLMIFFFLCLNGLGRWVFYDLGRWPWVAPFGGGGLFLGVDPVELELMGKVNKDTVCSSPFYLMFLAYVSKLYWKL